MLLCQGEHTIIEIPLSDHLKVSGNPLSNRLLHESDSLLMLVPIDFKRAAKLI
jgi:hypothetical protein